MEVKVEFKNIFYRLIESIEEYNHISKDELFIEGTPQEIISIFNSNKFAFKRDNLDYYTASMLLLDSKYLTDDAFLYYLPNIAKIIVEEIGLISALILRLKSIDYLQLPVKAHQPILEFSAFLKGVNLLTAQEQKTILSLL